MDDASITEGEQPDDAVLEQWERLPSDRPLVFRLTRVDMEQLILSLRRVQDAVMSSAGAVLSAGHADQAKAEAERAQEYAMQSMTHLTRFMHGFMPRTTANGDE